MEHCAQEGILQPVTHHGRYLFFALRAPLDPLILRKALAQLAMLTDGTAVVVGVGMDIVKTLETHIPGLRAMPDFSGHGVLIPSTPTALWCWLRGTDPGELLIRGRTIEKALSPALQLHHVLDAFRHGDPAAEHGRDLTGYEDGTENPQGDSALTAALVLKGAPGMTGSSFVAVQQWEHNMDAFDTMAPHAQDHAIGRRRSDNEELDDAPASAHVKRTAQESFTPEAFVLRRSMPWSSGETCGLVFVAFGRTLDAFEAQMRRMAGQEDGIVDALFGFSRPLTGAYLWCPPVRDGRLDFSQLGVSH
jgi:putative iron-dependent peroxidase